MDPAKAKPQSDLLPSYHLLVAERSDYAYSSTAREFESHLAIIGRVRTATPNHATAPALTFDDGHASQFRYGFPLLEKYGLRAVFFSVAGWIGQRPAYMTWDQLRELIKAGHQVQSHGLSHVQLTRCSDAELAKELNVSRSELQQKLGTAVDAISIPFGRWDNRVIAACANAGYRRVYTSDPFPPSQRFGSELLGRWMVSRNTTLQQLQAIVTGDPQALRWSAAKHRCKLLVRSAIGERIYDGLWGVLRSRESLTQASEAYPRQAESR